MTVLREPRIRDFLSVQGIADDQERTIALLGSMVLDDEGNPVGKDAILDAPASALEELSIHVPKLMGSRKDVEDPLALKSA